MHASFELVRAPRGHLYGGSGYAVQHIVEEAFSSCPTDPLSRGEVVYATPPAVDYVSAQGSFPYRYRALGALLSSASARLDATFDTDPFGNPPQAGCRGTLRWTLSPAVRRRVRDGRWLFNYSDGSRVSVSVQGGGRSAVGLALPTPQPDCQGQPGGGFHGAITLFIPAGGATNELVAASSTLSAQLQLNFTDPTHAGGQFILAKPGCTSARVSIEARRM